MEKQGIEKVLEEFKEKFWTDEADLRSWMLKRAVQRPEEEEWLRSAIETALREVRQEEKEEIEAGGIGTAILEAYNRGYNTAISHHDQAVSKYLGK